MRTPLTASTVEHGVQAEPPRQRRGIDMSTFTARFHELTDGPSSSSSGAASQPQQHNNPHAVATPPDVNGLLRLLLSQFTTLHPELAGTEGGGLDGADNPDDPAHEQAIRRIVSELVGDLDRPTEVKGVSQEYLDMLERVPKKTLKPDDACPICAENFLDDQYPLVVELRCKTKNHKFDLDCVAPWLQMKGDCPMCRADQTQYDPRNSKKKVQPQQQQEEEEEDEDPDMMYA